MANYIVYDGGMIDVTTIDHAERLPNNSVNIYRKDGLCSIRVTKEQFAELAEEMKRRYSPLSVGTPSVVSTTCRDKEVDRDLEKQLQEEKLCLAHSREQNNNLKQENTMLKEELDVRLKEASRIISTISKRKAVLFSLNLFWQRLNVTSQRHRTALFLMQLLLCRSALLN